MTRTVATGKRSLVPALARAGVAIGADALIVEVHQDDGRVEAVYSVVEGIAEEGSCCEPLNP